MGRSPSAASAPFAIACDKHNKSLVMRQQPRAPNSQYTQPPFAICHLPSAISH
jgi:hypothetical protein